MTTGLGKTLARRGKRRKILVGLGLAAILGGIYLATVGREWLAPVAWSIGERRLLNEVARMGGRTYPLGSSPGFSQLFGGLRHGVDLNGAPIGDVGLKTFAGATGDPIMRLDLANTGITDEGLEALANKVHLEALGLRNDVPYAVDPEARTIPTNRIGDKGLAHLARLETLSELNLSGLPVTDAGLVHLRRLSRIVTLHLDRTLVTGSGLAGLACIPQLGLLALDGAPVSDAGLTSLSGATNLQFLSLRGAKVSGPGLAHLARLPRLEDLDLDGCPLREDVLVYLAGPVPIQSLTLSGTTLSPKSLEPLNDPKILPKLKTLNLRRTGLTEAEVAGLRKLRPALKILLIERAMIRDPRGFYVPAPD